MTREISIEFAKKEAVDKRLMAVERLAIRVLEEKAVYNAGYPAWQAYWHKRREEVEVATVAKWDTEAMARTIAPNHLWVFIDLDNDYRCRLLESKKHVVYWRRPLAVLILPKKVRNNDSLSI